MQIAALVTAGLFGSLIGSFLNVVIYRLPLSLISGWRKECKEFLTEDSGIKFGEEKTKEKTFNLAFPASHCPSCEKPIPAWCNIPVLSFLLLKGKCLRCKTKISIRYPSVEILTAVITAFVFFHLRAKLSSTCRHAVLMGSDCSHIYRYRPQTSSRQYDFAASLAWFDSKQPGNVYR